METKVVLTMADAVNAYQERQAQEQAQEKELLAKIESKLLEKLGRAGLTPIRVERNVAFFEYDGEEVGFRIWDDNGWNYMCRVGKCQKCGEEIRSSEISAQLENFGKLLLFPEWAYHWCLDKNDETPEMRLVSALRELLNRE